MPPSTTSPPEIESDFCKRLSPVGRILEDPDYNVWGTSPIYGPDGKVHVFYSRWVNEADHKGWLTCSEVAHAVADDPAGTFETVDVPLVGRGGDWWDAMTCHNPTIHKVSDQYVLLYMGNQEGTQRTKRIGMATSESLYGPWKRSDAPILEPEADPNAWNSMITSNPALLQHPNGELWLYYKSWRVADWEKDKATDDWRNTHRTYGLAVAKDLNSPFIKREGGPLINLREKVQDAQCEDAYVWEEDGIFKLVMRDMGYWNHENGLYFESKDGIDWGDPQIAYYNSHRYFDEPKNGLDREGRFERAQMLMREGKPEYMFCAIRGGKYHTSSAIVLRVT
ncbi:MAG: glycoside hydrolase family protein [Verrucomicrobiota bacterium]